jgi:photosystem II stability/assembly factor-like uncharacterized protein
VKVPGDNQAAGTAKGSLKARGRRASRGAAPRVRALQAARRRVPAGGKAAARLQAFLEQRGLASTGASPGSRSARPQAMRATTRIGRGTSYVDALQAPRSRPRGAAAAAAPVWRFIGPRWIPEGQTYGSGPGASPPVSGRVTAIGIDPSDPLHLLVGSAGGGIWESADRGGTWAPRTDDQPILGIGALSFDPSDPRRVYAGTGEGNTLEVPGVGILGSRDGGATWRVLPTQAFTGAFFYDLVVDPAEAKRLFAATNTGAFRSDDRGRTWTRIRAVLTWDLSLHAGSSQGAAQSEVLVACQDGLYRSVNYGETWRKVALPGSPARFPLFLGRLAVAHAPSDGDVAYAFAALRTDVWLWRRDGAGGPFSAVPLPPLDPPDHEPGSGVSQAWYDWCLAVDPQDPDTVYLGAIDVFRGQRSPAGKWSWTDLSSRRSGDSIHPDQHVLAFDPTQQRVLYVGSDGGIFRSPDGGDSWQSLNKGLGITEFEYLAQNPSSGTWMMGGTQDNGTLRYRRDQIWDQVAQGDGGDCGVNASSPRICYHSYYGMAMERSRSAGDPRSWRDATPTVPWEYEALFYPPLEVEGSTVARAGTSVLISDDEGTTWVQVRLPKKAGALASAMTFASPTRLLVGRSKDGRIFRLDRDGGGWGLATTLATPREGYVSDLCADATTPDQYWATYSDLGGGHVYLSRDGGASWRDVTANLPDVPVHAVLADPTDPATVWIASEIGVFRTTTAGRSWSLFGEGLPHALAVDLLLHPARRVLRVGTRSRGVWEVDLS